jgi:hypothetical protein
VPVGTPPTPKPTPQRQDFDIPRDRRERYAQRALEAAVAIIDASVPGTRHHARLRAAYLLGGYVAGGVLREGEAYEALRAAVERNTEDLSNALKTVRDGLRDGQERPISLEELEAERHAWIASRRPVAPAQHRTPAGQDPWEGRYTLPLRPYMGIRLPREVRHG